jgi:hypothetical protein
MMMALIIMMMGRTNEEHHARVPCVMKERERIEAKIPIGHFFAAVVKKRQ